MLPGVYDAPQRIQQLNHVTPNVSYSPVVPPTQQWPAWGSAPNFPLHHVQPHVSHSPIATPTQQWPAWGQAGQIPTQHGVQTRVSHAPIRQ
eukprot:TRINITY_DN8_c0_g1_i1.p4 TRINITY_DN8_c0_g1~~TRINITY_DN8_c0_g1_i1.p4  ORF type:complete len:102 (+),score=16.84 TRINITY_DN8_c0_g1_i1:35-307(+)